MSTSEDRKRAFRKALGAFATGVTVVTTTDSQGNPVGVTASSFNSVSLEPPLVLWSLAKSSHSRPAFCSSGHFAIHVLAESQEEISDRFARPGEDKFDGVAWTAGAEGSPLLDEHAAVFECRTRFQYEGGDHIILVGEVISFDGRDKAPLLFHGGHYAERRARPAAESGETVDLERGQFTDNFLFYLLARAYFQTSRPTRERLGELDLDQVEHSTLAALSMQAPATADQINAMLEHTGNSPGEAKLDEMVMRGLLAKGEGAYDLETAGREKLISVLVASKAFEADIADGLTRGELAEAKRLLRKIIDLSGEEVPVGWRD